MQQRSPSLLRTVRIAAKLIRNNGKDRFRFADDGIIDPCGKVCDRSGLDRSVMFGCIGSDIRKIENRRN